MIFVENKIQPIPILLIVGVFLVLPFLVSLYVLHILTMIGIWAMLILGLNLIASMGYISICHAAFYGIGAYTASLLTLKVGTPFVLNLLAGTVLAGVASIFIGYPAFRVRGHYFAIATLAFGLIISLVLYNWGVVTNGDRGLAEIIGPIMDPRYSYYFILIVTLAVIFITHSILYSRFGRKLRAIRADENLASQIGINVLRTKVTAFVISALIAGLAGGMMAHYVNYIHPEIFSFANSFSMIMGMIVGGIGTTLGAILGSGVAMGLPEILRFSADARYILIGVVLIIVMLFLPQGIIGSIYEHQKKRRKLD